MTGMSNFNNTYLKMLLKVAYIIIFSHALITVNKKFA